MDAKITKTRLSNFLSYDWIKILLICILGVFVVNILYTTIATRVKHEQTFVVYAYTDIVSGEDYDSLGGRLRQKKVFSYEILEIQSESLALGDRSGEMYAARMADPAKTGMFVSSIANVKSEGYNLVSSYTWGSPEGNVSDYLNPKLYLQDCEEYLKKFFGEELDRGNLTDAAVRESFMARNEKDKRFRSEEKKQAGIQSERERLEKLLNDYTAVKAAMESEKISYSTITISEALAQQKKVEAGTYTCGFFLGKLNGLNKLYRAPVERDDGSKEITATEMSFLLFNTPTLRNPNNDLRYECVSFLRYLIDTYGE